MALEHTIIIGAGPAGSSAAYALARAGCRVTVVERLGIPGGLARTIERNGARYDIGPHRFFTRSKRIVDLWRAVAGAEFCTVPRLTRILFEGRLLRYPLEAQDVVRTLGMIRSMHALMSYLGACGRRVVCPRVAHSFEEWVSDQFGRELYEWFFKSYTEKVWGVSCAEIDAAWASQRMRGLNLPRAVLNALTGGGMAGVRTLVNEFLYPRTGAGSLYAHLLEDVVTQGGEIMYHTKATRVAHEGGEVIGVDVTTCDGRVRHMQGTQYISSMPLSDLVLRLCPAAPDEVCAAARALKYRTHICVNLLVRGNPYPDNWIYVHMPDARMVRTANYKNFSPAMCAYADRSPITYEYFTYPGDRIDCLSDAALIEFALAEGHALKLLPCAAPDDAFVIRNDKAYCVIARGYQTHQAVIARYLKGFRNLQTVGRGGMFKYNNQDHSIMTGLLAAENVLGAAHDIWRVNTEAEYHESGTAPDLCVEDRAELPRSMTPAC